METTPATSSELKPVVFAGLGFLGSWIMRFYVQRAAILKIINPIILIDNGEVEERNLAVQNMNWRHLGVPKTEVAASVAKTYRASDVAEFREKLEIHHIGQFEACLIVDAFDNLAARHLTHYMGIHNQCEVIHAAISPSMFGMVEWSHDWSLDPFRTIGAPPQKEQVEIPPCELLEFQMLGVNVALRAAEAMTNYLVDGKKASWYVSKDQTEKR